MISHVLKEHRVGCQFSFLLDSKRHSHPNPLRSIHRLILSIHKMLKVASLLIFAFAITQVLSLECYTGYSLVRGQTVGTTTQTCKKSSDQCYKAKADVSTLNKFKLAGCSTFRCMVRDPYYVIEF